MLNAAHRAAATEESRFPELLSSHGPDPGNIPAHAGERFHHRDDHDNKKPELDQRGRKSPEAAEKNSRHGNRPKNAAENMSDQPEEKPNSAKNYRLHGVKPDELVLFLEDIKNQSAKERDAGKRRRDVRRQSRGTGRWSRACARGRIRSRGRRRADFIWHNLLRERETRFVKVTRWPNSPFPFHVLASPGTLEFVSSIRVRAGQQSYEVMVGAGLLSEIGPLVVEKLEGPACAVVSDEKVAALYGDCVLAGLAKAGLRATLITVPAGEASKTMEQAEAICGRMIEAGLDRSSFVLALGGGMIGDLAGFVAAIFHRGVPCLQAPTTLLAQVDSSIGGKTAVNTAAGKNLIGAWHQPALVVSDVETLATLPPREFRQGFAEIVKHAVIADAEMFEEVAQVSNLRLSEAASFKLAPLVRRNVEIKGAIVANDERETTGLRALLNFGHTIGHAIERAGEYRDFLHGEAVSLGMVAACEISVRKAGLSETEREKIIGALRSFELPTALPANFPKEKILGAVRFDKKFAGGAVRFVVVPAIGCARVAADVTMQDIEAAVKKL